jgi:hypothetical protein
MKQKEDECSFETVCSQTSNQHSKMSNEQDDACVPEETFHQEPARRGNVAKLFVEDEFLDDESLPNTSEQDEALKKIAGESEFGIETRK